MRGRVRNFILFAFVLAFIVQLAVVFLYFPSSSSNSGLLLDESAFPASPRASLMPHSALSALANGYPQSDRQFINARIATTIEPVLTAAIEVQHPSVLSSVVSFAAEKQALAPSNLGQKYDLV
jgi:hypothetical protein